MEKAKEVFGRMYDVLKYRYFKGEALPWTEDSSSNIIRYLYGNIVEGRGKFSLDKVKEKTPMLQCESVKDE